MDSHLEEQYEDQQSQSFTSDPLTEDEIVRESMPREEPADPCRKCECWYEWQSYCGAKVCIGCDDHKGLARCYCGWADDGGDGRAQLVEMGETIDEEEW